MCKHISSLMQMKSQALTAKIGKKELDRGMNPEYNNLIGLGNRKNV
jgi:hypothetical protein